MTRSITRRMALSAGTALAATKAFAAAPLAGRQLPGAYRFRVGSFEVTALHDGQLGIPPALFAGAEPAEAARLARAAFVAEGAPVPTPVNAFAVNTGQRLFLIDAGTGAARGTALGHVAASMQAAGLSPDQVDAVLMTHLHIDHAAGLTRADGSAAFANAELFVPEAETGFWLAQGAETRMAEGQRASIRWAAAAATAYAGRSTRFVPGARIADGIESIALPGHTPGHTGFMIGTGAERLFLWADIVHVAAFQFARPDWRLAFDVDGPQAAATRARAMDQAASDRLMVAGMHLPFPGIGHVARAAEGYAFVPMPWRPLI